VSAIGERAKAAAAAGVPLHQYFRRPGLYTRDGFAVCGARRDQGAKFTTWAKYVTCADCLRVVRERRAKAKATFAAITGALALLLMVGCGGAADAPSLAGDWSYTWPVPGQPTLHGIMTLAEGAGVVTGVVGLPVELAGTDQAPAWNWSLAAAVAGDHVPCYVRGPDGVNPWWWDLTLTGDSLAGPTYSPVDTPQATFAAVRE
jgi:hypothetical protein